MTELGDTASSFHYFRSTSSFLASLAAEFHYEPALDSLKNIAGEFLAQLNDEGALVIDGQEIPPELLVTARITDLRMFGR